MKALRKILFVSYHFPPIGGAAAQRPMQLVRHLPSYGYEPIVITGPGNTSGRWAPSDPTLTGGLPSDVQVLRVQGPEPAEAAGWRSRSERWLGAESDWARWWIDGVVDAASRAAEDAELIYTVVSPYETVEACSRISLSRGVPWVADLGDPWALDDMAVYLTALHRRHEVARMGRGLASAGAIVMSTPEAVHRVEAHLSGIRPRLLTAIPNGYDRADFEGPPPARSSDDNLRIVHTGYLHTELGQGQHRAASLRRVLGGGSRGVDVLTRSHVYLLEAVNRLLELQPDVGRRIEVHLAGVTTTTDEQIAASCPAVRLHGYLPHSESVSLLRGADLLFLPMQKLFGGRRSGNVPGKTYEYLASGRPILGAVPPGDARDLLERAGGAFVCEPDDVHGMERILSERVRGARGEEADPERDHAVVAEYEWHRLAGRVADVLGAVLDPARLAGIS
jgi:glycosyltransferase involved in cell wall biosynthesis